MRNKKGMRVMALIIALLMLLSVAGPILLQVLAADEITELQNKLDNLTKQQKELQKKINSSTANRKSELQKKNELEQEINNFNDKIGVYDELITQYDEQIAAKEAESVDIQSRVDSQTEIYLARIRETYERGTLSYLDVLFSSGSLRDFLTHMDYAAEIARYDEQLITAMRDDKQAVLDAKAEIELARTEQATLKEEAESDRSALKKRQDQADANIKAYDGDIARQKELLEEAEAEEERFLAELKKLLAARANSEYIGGDMIWPTPGYKTVTSPFGMRTHPVTGVYKLHTGIDIGAAGGSKILAANAGTVVSAGYNSAWGNYIAVDHGGGLSTFYAHMKYSASVGVGATVARGEQIGVVGTTGLSTGNHLHFEVRVRGDSVQPLDYVTPS
ncbi:MAG: peptidoglycan DD-metalloendopeptidase family protein [Clostridia bacterium]|nr:peptidoglycan DD-metalloendopeptidase family protein [Clostridia bacterium]MBQ3077275.1 peptidoglycan DD-metalloendopeptidase family protein [Clostridia bacterium]